MQIRDTNSDWARLAEENPYWAVLSSDKYKGQDLPADVRKEYFDGGAELVKHDFALLRERLCLPFAPLDIVDFGCGVGRLSIPLAQMAKVVHALDVAPRMLEICQKNAYLAGAANVRPQSTDEFIAAGTEFDLFYSRIVIQHIPPTVGIPLLRKLFGRLRPKGGVCFNVTFARDASHASVLGAHARYVRGLSDRIELYGQTAPLESPHMSMYEYDLNELMLLLLEHGIHDPVVQVYGGGGYYAAHFFGLKR